MTQFAGKYSRGGESDPHKHFSTTYGVHYNPRDGKYGHCTGTPPKSSGFATNGRSVAPPSPVAEDAIEDAARVHPPRPSRRQKRQFGIEPNGGVDIITYPRQRKKNGNGGGGGSGRNDSMEPVYNAGADVAHTSMYRSGYRRYEPMSGLDADNVHRARTSGFSRQVAVDPPMITKSEAQVRKALVPRLDAGIITSQQRSSRPRGDQSAKAASSPRKRISKEIRDKRRADTGMNIGRRTETGFSAGNKVDPHPAPFEGSSTYRDSYARRSHGAGNGNMGPLPAILRGDRGTGFELGNKTEQAGVPGVLAKNPRDLYPKHIHPKVLQRIKDRDPVEFTNLLHIDRPMLSTYRAQFEKNIGEGEGFAGVGKSDWDDLQGTARELTLEPTTQERIKAARTYIGSHKGMSSFVKNNQPNIGVTTTEVVTDDERRWQSVAKSSFTNPLKGEYAPPEADPKARMLQSSAFQSAVIPPKPSEFDPARAVSSKRRLKNQ